MRPSSRGHSHADERSGSGKNFMVVVRVRPPLPRELHGPQAFRNVVHVDKTTRMINISENPPSSPEDGGASTPGPYSTHSFTFDHVHDQHDDQKTVYAKTAKAVVESSLQGYNATIFAYGQTGTGKTYTMEGFDSKEHRGIIPRAIEQIFLHITSSVSPRMRFLVRASYLQIYNEVISDLLKPDRTNLVIREDKKKGVYVEGLSEWVVRSPQEIYGLMQRGGEMRATGSTRMNHLSSRSHAVFIIIAEQSETTYVDESGKELTAEQFHHLVKSRAHGDEGMKALETNVRQSFKVGKLNLVDLAGSERVRLSGATGLRLKEASKINQSLSALGNVIAALTDPSGRQHIPYRDSKLTRILEDSLGGNCKTTMMAMVSPALEAFVESLSTLKFANRAKNIKNEAKINEDLDHKSMLRRYERELKRLRSELETRNRNVVDKRRLLELDEQRRRAELDKMAAIRALEARSREFLREKEEKRKLEDRISALQSQMLIGGDKDSSGAPAKLLDTPAFRTALKEHQEKIRQKYEQRLSELEKERETIEEEKAQVDRYKQLLLKQRDIMILLTQRLNERDDQIVALQDELDAYDRHQRDLEEKLDEKTAALIHLQRVALEHTAASPVKSAELRAALGLSGGAASGAGKPTPRGRTLSSGSGAAAEGGSLAGHSEGKSPGGVTSISPEAKAAAERTLREANVDTRVLISAKQFRALEEQTVFMDKIRASSSSEGQSSSGGAASPVLLSAEEKIQELQAALEATKAEQERHAREVEEVKAEKVSLEYLLRERLDKLVQAEVEGRLAAQQKEGSDPSTAAAAATVQLQRLEHEAKQRDAELSQVKGELEAARRRLQQKESESASGPSSGLAAPVAASLRSRLSTHEKERKAIHTIVENKIKALTDNIVAYLGQGHATSADELGQVRDRAAREARALQRLVNASVSALRNAEAEAQRAAQKEAELEAELELTSAGGGGSGA